MRRPSLAQYGGDASPETANLYWYHAVPNNDQLWGQLDQLRDQVRLGEGIDQRQAFVKRSGLDPSMRIWGDGRGRGRVYDFQFSNGIALQHCEKTRKLKIVDLTPLRRERGSLGPTQ